MRLDLGRDPLLLLADLGGLGLELLGVAPGRGRLDVGRPAALRTRSAASDWVPRSRSRSPDSANQVSWARASAGRSSRSAASSARLPLAGAASCASTSLAPRDQDRLVGQLLLERGTRP